MALTKVSSSLVSDNAITTGKLVDGGVHSADIATNAITSTKIAQNSILTKHIDDGQVTTAQLGADAVTAAKIADDAISEEHLDVTVITGLTEVTAATGDLLMVADISDSNNLKKIPVSSIQAGRLALTGGTITGTVVFNSAPTFNTAIAMGSTLNVASSIGIAGTTVIDSSRNLTNIGTISAGVFTTNTNTGTFSNSIGSFPLVTSTPYDYVAKFESTDAGAAIIIEDSSSTNNGNRVSVNGDTMSFFTGATSALTLDASQNATFAGTIAGTLATAAQTNITSLGTLTSLNTSGSVTMNKSVASGAFLTDATIYPLRLTNDDTTAGNAVALTFGQGGFDFTNFIASVRTGTGNDPKGDLVFGGRPSDGSPFLERMRIQANGHLGIGTDNPGYALDISNTASAKINLQGGTNQNGIRFASAGNDGVSSSTYYLGVGSDLMSGTDYGAVLLDVTNNRSILLDDQSNSRLSLYNNKIFIDNNGLHVRNGSALRLLPTDNHDTDPWILYQYTDNTLRYNFTGAGADEIIIKYPNATNATTLLVDAEQQRVGIGTDGPLATLHLKSTTTSSGPSIIFENTNNAQTMDIDYYSNAGSVQSRIQYAEGPGSFSFFPDVTSSASLVMDYNGVANFHANRNEYGITISSAGTRSGLVLEKPGTSTVMGSILMLSDESFRLGTASNYHIKMLQDGTTWFGNTTNYSKFDASGHLQVGHGGEIKFEAAANDFSTIYTSAGYASESYTTSQRYWNHLISKGGTHITINSDSADTASENTFDDFVVWQGSQDTAEPLFRVSNTGRVIAKQNYEIGNHKTNREEFGVNAINTIDEATSDINTTTTNTYENRPGVYWLNYNSKRFRGYVKPNWLQNRNWILAAKFFSHMDMPSGSSLWTNDTSWNGGDFDLNNGHFSKYGKVWRYFGFNRLAMQMGDRVAPIMQFSSTQTLYGAFSGGRAGNGGGVSPTSTDPALSTGAIYHSMTNYLGGTFTDLGGLEDKMQSYGLNKWANSSTNSTSANNQGSRSLTAGGKGFELTVEDSHDNIGGNDSVGFAGAWIGCPLDEGNCNPLATSSNTGADSGFGFGGGCGNNARTWTSGIAEWGRGNEVANYLPAYIWLSID